MANAKLYEEWQKLCDEHISARDTYFEALAVVNQKFMAIGQGTSKANPSSNPKNGS